MAHAGSGIARVSAPRADHKSTASSRELEIEGVPLFSLFVYYIHRSKTPILSVKRIIEMPLQLMTSQTLFQGFGPCSPGPLCSPGPSVFPKALCLSLGVSTFSSHIMDRHCRCEMTVGKSFYFIVTKFSFVIISRKGDFVALFCEYLVMMTPNHIHRSQLWSS